MARAADASPEVQGLLTRNDREGDWAFAAKDESLDSFLARLPPSRSHGMEWISACHAGRERLVAEYYASASKRRG